MKFMIAIKKSEQGRRGSRDRKEIKMCDPAGVVRVERGLNGYERKEECVYRAKHHSTSEEFHTRFWSYYSHKHCFFSRGQCTRRMGPKPSLLNPVLTKTGENFGWLHPGNHIFGKIKAIHFYGHGGNLRRSLSIKNSRQVFATWLIP